MTRAQPQYLIVANRRRKTHRPGIKLVYTGPRSGICRGWTSLGRVSQWIEGGYT